MQPTTGAYAPNLLGLVTENQLFVTRPPWWPQALPSPEVTAAVLLGMFVVAVVVIVLIVRIVVPGGIRLGQTLTRIWNRITPKSTFGKVMVIFTVLLAVATAPAMYTLSDAKGTVEDVGAGAAPSVMVDGDVVGDANGTMAERRVIARPSQDRDGDRLPDSWERAETTPDGVPLPNANVGRKDVYLQVLYGRGIESLSSAEQRELRNVWAQMPVENPDGSTGISLHIVDERRLSREVKTDDPETAVFTRYGRRHLGGATCVYYQTTFGDFSEANQSGYAAVGSYASVVDGTEVTFRNGRTDRTLVLTHELLHNTAGVVETRTHTAEGWLSTRDLHHNDYLSPATADSLESGFVRYAYDDQPSCGDDG